jgi:fatty-acyl-CoA synthase
VANGLTRLGIAKGDRVGVLLPNVPEYLETFFALAKIGAVMVLINWRLGNDEIRFMLSDADACGVLVHQSRCQDLVILQEQLPSIQHVVVVEAQNGCPFMAYDAITDGESSELAIDVDVELEDDQLLLYTSGTTGRPKGAVISHENTLWNSFNQIVNLSLTADDSTLVICPLFHVSGLYDLTFPLLHVGGTVVVAKRFEARETLQTVSRLRISTLMTVPTMIYDLLKVPDLEQYDRSSLRLLVCGGAPLSASVIEETIARLSSNFVQGYGLTEGTSVGTFLPSEDGLRRIGSIGKPFLHVDLKLVDGLMQEVSPGEVGEIALKGKTVVRGYWNLPEETARSFRDGWCLTGDLARKDEDGYLYLVDRKKHTIISGGENIYPKEIEEVLSGHQSVLECSVVGVPDERWGEAVMAVIVLRPGHSLSVDDLLNYCRDHLASYKKPRYVRFVDQLPRNSTGKVLKAALRDQMLETRDDGDQRF